MSADGVASAGAAGAVVPPKSNREGPLNLVAVQQPIETFHKDEGGKSNQLQFRVLLQGALTPELNEHASDQLLLSVTAVFEDGSPIDDPTVLEIMGCTERANSDPFVSKTSRLGGVSYRFGVVSKRHGDKRFAIQVALKDFPQVAPLSSTGTMVFSKRKNPNLRTEARAKEMDELKQRERAALALLEQTAYSPLQGLPPKDEPKQASKRIKTDSTGRKRDDEGLLRRIKALESVVAEQGRRIDELSSFINFNPTPGTALSKVVGLSPLAETPMLPLVKDSGRSESQAFWESRPDRALINAIEPGQLLREVSSSSFFDMAPKF